VFAAIGVAAVATGALWALTVIAFCGLGAVVAGRQIKRPLTLELTPSTMTLRESGSERRAQWEFSRCGEFRPWGRTLLNRGNLVTFDYEGGPAGPPPMRALKAFNRSLRASNASIPAIFGMSAPDMARLLNEYRDGRRPRRMTD
jgi:hypothetical protein